MTSRVGTLGAVRRRTVQVYPCPLNSGSVSRLRLRISGPRRRRAISQRRAPPALRISGSRSLGHRTAIMPPRAVNSAGPMRAGTIGGAQPASSPLPFPTDCLDRQVRRHVAHRQLFGACRSVHQRVPWQVRHHAPGRGGVTSAVLGIRANPGGRSLMVGHPSSRSSPARGTADR